VAFGGQGAEKRYLVWKARQVADAAAGFAAPVLGARTRGETKRQRVEAVPESLRARAAPEGGKGLPGVEVVHKRMRQGEKKAALLGWVVKDLKPGVFEDLMDMMG
jgi:hypothetical protein